MGNYCSSFKKSLQKYGICPEKQIKKKEETEFMTKQDIERMHGTLKTPLVITPKQPTFNNNRVKIDQNKQVTSYLSTKTDHTSTTVVVDNPFFDKQQIEISETIQFQQNDDFEPQKYVLQHVLRKLPQERQLNQKSNQFPYNCIGMIRAIIQDNMGIHELLGTGTLISSRFVLTSAHNVVNVNTGKLFENLKFYPRINGIKDSLIIQNSEVETILFSQDYLKLFNQKKVNPGSQDYALIYLKTEIVRPKYISVGYNFTKEVEAQLFGYPFDLIQMTLDNQYRQFGMTGNVIEIKDGLILHNIDTFKGQSGSPILIKLAGQIPFIIGIHSNYSKCKFLNVACHITNKIKENMTKMATKMSNGQHFFNSQKMHHIKIPKITISKNIKTPFQIIFELTTQLNSGESNNSKLANINFQLMKQHYNIGNYQKSKKYGQLGLKITTQNKMDGEGRQFYNYLGRINLKFGQFKEAQLNFTKYQNYIQNQKGWNSLQMACALINMGNLYNQNNFTKKSRDKAMKYYEQAYKIQKQLNTNSKQMASILGNIALIFWRQNQLSKATQKFQEALRIKEKLYNSPHFQISLTIFNLSLCKFDNLKYEEWLNLHFLSLKMMKELGLKRHPSYKKRMEKLKDHLEKLTDQKKYKSQYIQKGLEVIKELGEQSDYYQKLGEKLKKMKQ